MSAPVATAAWPTFGTPDDVERVEAVPLADRDLPATTYQVLRRAAGQWPERVAVSVMPDAARWREAVSLTYGELLDQVDRVANALVRRGVSPTTPVALIAPNCLQLVPAMLGVQAAGVAVPLNAGLSPEHLATLLERAGVRHAVVASPDLDGGIWAKLSGLAAAGHLDHLYLLDPTDGTRSSPAPVAGVAGVVGVVVEYLADAAAAEQPGYDDPHTAEDIAAVFHTGGTTGIPKLAAHTHANQVVDAWLIAADSTADSSGEPATMLGALPLFHVNALHVTMLAPMLKGQRVVWAGPLGYRDPALYGEIWRIVEHFSVATMSAVPTVYAVLAGCPVDADISSLRFAVVGASALPLAVRTAFESHTGVPLLEGYGLTEGTCASARSFVSDPRPGSVGKRLPYQQLRVVDVAPDGSWTDVPAGGVGTLLIGGPTVFAGYVTGRGDDGFVLDHLGKVRDGWLDTGDLARIDDGFLYLTGRAKDLIIRGGHNIDPAAIEDALRAHPAVADAAAVGRPHPRAGEVPVAYVTVAAGTETSAGELEAFMSASSLEPAARPKSVTIVDALPVTDVGKPYKLALRADAARRAIEDALAGAAGVTGVEGLVVDGSVRVVVTIGPGADAVRVRHRLDQFALASEVVTP